jgi:hypothetical protein
MGFHHDGTADTTKEKMKSVEPRMNAESFYRRLSAFIGGSNISLHSLGALGVLGG